MLKKLTLENTENGVFLLSKKKTGYTTGYVLDPLTCVQITESLFLLYVALPRKIRKTCSKLLFMHGTLLKKVVYKG